MQNKNSFKMQNTFDDASQTDTGEYKQCSQKWGNTFDRTGVRTRLQSKQRFK